MKIYTWAPEPLEGCAQPMASPRHLGWPDTQEFHFLTPKCNVPFCPGAVSQAEKWSIPWYLCPVRTARAAHRCREVATSDEGWTLVLHAGETPHCRDLGKCQPKQTTLQQVGQVESTSPYSGRGAEKQAMCSFLNRDVPARFHLEAREKNEARTWLSVSPKITVSPSALPRNRIWNHSILAKLEFAYFCEAFPSVRNDLIILHFLF